MGSKIAIGLVQMRMSDNPRENLEKVLTQISRASKKGARIVCLPELFMTPYFPSVRAGSKKLPDSYLETIPGFATNSLSLVAKENGIVLVAGSLYERKRNKVFNTSAVFGPNGRMLGIYRKMHVPQDEYFFEKDYFLPGDLGFKVFKTGFGKISPLICFDQWFPEAARVVSLAGAQIIFYPTAIGTVKGVSQVEGKWHDAWENVMRGHAIANSVVVAAVNRCGREGKTNFWGGSFVCDAFGKTLARLGNNEEVLVTEIDLKHGQNIRDGWRFFKNRRTDAYSPLLK